MMYSINNVFYKNLSKKPIILSEVREKHIVKNIKNKLSTGAIPGGDYGRYIYYCNHCRIINVKFYFSLKDNQEIYTPKYNCKICGNEIKRIYNTCEEKYDSEFNDDLISTIGSLEIKCQKCGKNNILIEEIGLWD